MAGVEKERLLIKKAKDGDEDSFTELLDSCRARAYNVAFRYFRNEEDALDALQESFLKIFRHLGKFKEDSRFDTWVYRIVVNTCNDMLRKKTIEKSMDNYYSDPDEERVFEIPDGSPSPEERLVHKERGESILACLDRISHEHKEVIVLRDIQGFSYGEIAEILECDLGTVKSRINRARNKLRDKILEQNQF